MITEDYVSFETAKLLKDKGFDAECDYLYVNGELVRTQGFACNWNNGETIFADYKNECSAPTLQMAIKWLREIHNVLVVTDYDYECTDKSYGYKIYKLGENGKPERVPIEGVRYDTLGEPHVDVVAYRDYKRSFFDYETYEEACEAGIRYCLEKLI